MSSKPIDLPSALERVDNDKEFLDSLLDMFQEDFAEKSGLLQAAVSAKDFRAIGEIGHSLKGASANLSLLPLQEACFRMEKAGREQDIRLAEDTLSLMEEEFKKLKEYLASPNKE
jgi:HPt (histidine-containing phosphotransfer) domain-containing protein